MVANKKRKRVREIMDGYEKIYYKLFFVTICISMLGLLMVASVTYSEKGAYYVSRQLIFILLGFVMMVTAAYIDFPRIIYRFSKFIYAVGILLLLSLLTPMAVSSHGATRWVNLPGGIQIQPTEITKITVIILLAYVISKGKHLSSPKLTFYLWLAGGVPAVLVLTVSSDLSSAVVILAVTFLMTFCFTNTWKVHLAVGGSLLSVIGAYLLYFMKHLPDPAKIDQYPYRVARLAAWLRPGQYPDASYQTQNAMTAIKCAGWFGTGLAKIRVKIPEAQNDFIFAAMIQQLGILSGIFLILLYGYVVYCIIKISFNAATFFESVLTAGIAFHIGVQVCINIAVNIALLPNTGLPLPLMSYGGSSILCALCEIGICISVGKKELVKTARNVIRRNGDADFI